MEIFDPLLRSDLRFVFYESDAVGVQQFDEKLFYCSVQLFFILKTLTEFVSSTIILNYYGASVRRLSRVNMKVKLSDNKRFS